MIQDEFASIEGTPAMPADTRRQPRSMATGRFGKKSGESQEFLADLVAPHDSGVSLVGAVLRRRAPNAWRILEQVMK